MIAESGGFNQTRTSLYQAEITALVSASLVVIRLVASTGSALLAWRLVFALLEKSGITLSEICRVVDFKMPIIPRFSSFQQIHWSVFAILITLLIWPYSIAAPLASSSLQWIPSTRIVPSQVQNYMIPNIDLKPGWDKLGIFEDITELSLKAATMGIRTPSQATLFDRSSPHFQRQFFYLSPQLTQGGVGSIAMPYFEVTSIRWIDQPKVWAGDPLQNASMIEKPIPSRRIGATGFVLSSKATSKTDTDEYKYEPIVYEGQRIVSVLVGRLVPPGNGDAMDQDGSEAMPCPNTTTAFGQVPEVTQQRTVIYYAKRWAATDCWMYAEVSIRAGKTTQEPCDIQLIGPADDMHIAMGPNRSRATKYNLEPDLSVLPTLDLTSDVLRNLYLLNVSGSYKHDNLDGYVGGMLETAYYTANSAILYQTKVGSDPISVTPLEPVILASINRTRLWVWFAVNATLSIAALLFWIVWSTAGFTSKLVRKPTLVALMMDLSSVSHVNGDGLCNAVDLSKEDKKLGR
jgi:hypothetical protein